MNARAFLAAAENLPIADLAEVMGAGGLVVVAPHPDDESLGCGGMIAEARARGLPVQLVVLTDGVGSHRRSVLYPPARLKTVRESETIEAASVLGLDRECIRFVGLPDAGLSTDGPDADLARTAIVEAASTCKATTVCVTWRHDPHCDHRAAALLVDTAVAPLGPLKVLAYPIWGWSLPPKTMIDGQPRGIRLDITRHLPSKSAAVAAHRSQTTDLIDDDPTGFRLDHRMLERFARPFEIFLENRS